MQQELFIIAYIGVSAGNALDAARRAGYKGNNNTLKVTGHNLLTRTNIQQEIQRRQALMLKNTPLDLDWWRRQMMSRFDHCTKPKLDSEGKPGQIAVDETNARGYGEILGRHIGAFEEDNRQRQNQIAIVLR